MKMNYAIEKCYCLRLIRANVFVLNKKSLIITHNTIFEFFCCFKIHAI